MAHYGFTMSQSYALIMARAYNKTEQQKPQTNSSPDADIELSHISHIHDKSKTTNLPPKPENKKYIRQITTYGTF
jgi:hypothetical protein